MCMVLYAPGSLCHPPTCGKDWCEPCLPLETARAGQRTFEGPDVTNRFDDLWQVSAGMMVSIVMKED